MKKFLGFVKKDDGVVAIEWVGIAAVMLVAAIAIAGIVTTGVYSASNDIGTEADTMADSVSTQDPNCFKTASC